VFLHHALAGWPAWPGVGGGAGRALPLRAGVAARGGHWPDSGFRYARYTVRVCAFDHPVCAGVDDFELNDELYCCPVFSSDVVPLLRADAPSRAFRETYHEVLGTPRSGPAWEHPAASDLIGWAKTAGRSPVVYLQPGDGPDTFAHPAYRRLVGNALEWVSSGSAREWACAASHPSSPAVIGFRERNQVMDLQLTGRKALVTGASRCIGRAIAVELAREGCDLALCAAAPSRSKPWPRSWAARSITQALDVSDEQGRGRLRRAPRPSSCPGWTW